MCSGCVCVCACVCVLLFLVVVFVVLVSSVVDIRLLNFFFDWLMGLGGGLYFPFVTALRLANSWYSCARWLLASAVVGGLLSLCRFHFLLGRAVM